MEFICVILCLINLVLLIVLLTKKNKVDTKEITSEVNSSVKLFADVLTGTQRSASEIQDKRLEELTKQLTESQNTLQKTVNDNFKSFDERFAASSMQTEKRLENIRGVVEERLKAMQEDNNRKLDLMRNTVDEKLQKTLDDKIGQSFKLVSERLEQVYKGLGEMQNLAVGVGDLKRVLSNVKTRGILGEIQLGSILEDILAPDQYDKNVATKKGSQGFVEYAVKLPGDGNSCVYLPIDAKFPADAYENLMAAYEEGNPENIASCASVLDKRIKQFAKDIRDKYISPPDTTDFGIMFLPTEGLYSEAVKRGLFELVQHEYNVVISGPSNMAALLNSLQMGFKTLAIQKRSGEVWTVLEAVKNEFNKFGTVLAAAQNKIDSASSELDKLVGVRTRQIQRKLMAVSSGQEDVNLLSDEEE